MIELFVGQLIALITFFGFPVIQYVLLKRFTKKECLPELWYLPDYGFRLVIRNIVGKRTLSNIKYQTVFRKVIPPSTGSSVSSLFQYILVKADDFFVLPGTDQILLSFRLEKDENDVLYLVHTDITGQNPRSFQLSEKDCLISDYFATVENLFNFNVHLAKRIEIDSQTLLEHYKAISLRNIEQKLKISKTHDI